MTNYEQIEIQVKNSPTLKMLRGGNAALTISFLLTIFKETNEQPVFFQNLIQKLANYLDDLNYQDEEETSLNS
ncbi:MAG: DUF3375 family protein, partial [Prevotellaceae bacterium]|nr:DUF3375 family protein [Prevotellaceae bacterium]